MCNTIYSSSFLYKVLYTQTDTNKNKHFTTSSYNLFAIWYTCMCTKEVIPFFFFSMFYIQLFTYFIHNICLTTSQFVSKNTFYRRSCKTKKWTFPSWSPQTSCRPEDSVIISMLVTGAGHRNCPTYKQTHTLKVETQK